MKKYKKIGIFVGHSILKDGKCTSADGRSKGGKLEYAVNKELAYEIEKWFKSINQDCDVIVVPEKKYGSGQEDDYKLPLANSGKYDLVVELHCNAHDGSATGSEVLYISDSGKVVAQRVQNKLKTMFRDRGLKHRDNLYMLTKTKPTSIMLETLFCDSKTDCAQYDKLGKTEVARRIVEGICDTTISSNTNTTTGTEEIWYRAVAGSFKSKDLAEKRVKELADKGYSGCFVVSFKKTS